MRLQDVTQWISQRTFVLGRAVVSLPGELDLPLHSPEQPQPPLVEIDLRGAAVGQDRPVLHNLLARRQASSIPLPVLCASGEQIKNQGRTFLASAAAATLPGY